LIIVIISSEGFILWRSSVSSYLHPLIIPSPSGPHILLSPLFSNTLSVLSSRKARGRFSHQRKQQAKLQLLSPSEK
jgi:hypothetical protein